MRMRWGILGLLVLPCFAHADEPIITRNGRAVSLAFLRLTPRTETLERGLHRLDFRLLSANDARFERGAGGAVREDYELTRLEVAAFESLRKDLDIEFRAAVQTLGSGVLDPLIEAWHNAILHWRRPEREGLRDGRMQLELPGSRSFSSGSGLTDMSVQLNKDMGKWIASVSLKAPVGKTRHLLGSGGWDFGLGVGTVLWRKGRWEANGAAALIHQGPSRDMGRTRRWIDQETVSVQYRGRAGQTWVIQWQSEASAQDFGVPASDATHRLMSFGWRKGYSSGSTLEVYFSEDRDLFDGGIRALANMGPDFTLGVNWSVRR